MSHLVAFIGNDPEHLPCALFQARLALYWNDPGHLEGYGLGFVQGGDVLLQKRPRPGTSEIDFYNLARDLRADALIGRVGLPEDGQTATENADPFRFRTWLFGTVGDVAGFDQVRERLLQSIPDFLRRNIRGRSPSEHVFHLFLAFLHDAGIIEAQGSDPLIVQRALHEAVTFLDRLQTNAGEGSPKLAAVATNGRVLVAESRGYPIHFLELRGVTDCSCPTCPDRARVMDESRRITHEGLRAIVIEADQRQPERGGWTQVPEGHSLVLGLDRVARILPNA